ncbi:nucleoside 2-deoxyribosyltransferase [Prochlorococcus marinus str. MU1404]|uniref:nucleoside 2-deoxyribosyltransferase n=1 Tax=Prochlorococcus marinus TaxID=1219 RepID=UPI001ADD3DFE|nr:nucleoside 2-deoxyribosyltransferase [Prochlorococcus marinus]MBO8230218.1 nucleoside 2-deoxyribosyltransferase [Prochlorococcus marinus XMU1404]MBW3073010.1 nucleoside 2-deoxyribosyltransferase [Prochlorococcus marinus str. MU1404]MCR8545445.1 nucleoside 2-deoxyribosyltransferase [Prochlorococcus marinus CUG1432]
MKKKLYFANPYGFSKQTKKLLYEFINIFNKLNIEVYEPFERTKNIIKKENEWAYDLARSNFHDLKECDGIFAIVNGTPPDEGVMIELGIAIALKKEIFLFRDDFRNCSDNNQYPLNLMLFIGLPRDNWEKYFFESLEEIKSNKKGFVEWAKKPN